MPKKARFDIILKIIQEQIALARTDLQTFALKIIWVCFDCPLNCSGACARVHERAFRGVLEIEQNVQKSDVVCVFWRDYVFIGNPMFTMGQYLPWK